MPLVQTRGAGSAQGFGQFAQTAAASTNYIEEVFSSYNYQGNNSTQTITNNIDLSTKGGLVWIKADSAVNDHKLTDTVRGATKALSSNTTGAEVTNTNGVTAFNTTGFTMGNDVDYNSSSRTFMSLTFREQAKFFDVVTWSGSGINTTIPHNLGVVPGCIIVKRTDTTADGAVYHRSLANTQYLVLNDTAAAATGSTWWNSTTPTSAVFSVGTNASVNASGGTYVAFLFAHDAGGFGLTGTDNVISCGTFTSDGSGNFTATLGYEPQFVMYKSTSSSSPWYMLNITQSYGFNAIGDSYLRANTTDQLFNGSLGNPTATGFEGPAAAVSTTYIYIAARRGPMKIPTLSTNVFNPVARAGTGTNTYLSSIGFSPDVIISLSRGGSNYTGIVDRLRGINYTSFLSGIATDAEVILSNPGSYQGVNALEEDRIVLTADDAYSYINYTGYTYATYLFKRAPSFIDQVCYTGTGANTTQAHNLGVAPELIIVKRRDAAGAWDSYSSALANTEYLVLNTTAAKATGATRWNSTTATASVFSVGTSVTTNASAGTYVAYLFATCPGVSKVGSYAGNALLTTIDCGFIGGARFVMIKRTNSTSNWFVWDTSRGMTSGTDPSLALNSSAAESNANSVYTIATGFQLLASPSTDVNTSGGTYIFLAIA